MKVRHALIDVECLLLSIPLPKEALKGKGTVIFKEYSCNHGEPYYPVWSSLRSSF
jgi:hypothetical protein